MFTRKRNTNKKFERTWKSEEKSNGIRNSIKKFERAWKSNKMIERTRKFEKESDQKSFLQTQQVSDQLNFVVSIFSSVSLAKKICPKKFTNLGGKVILTG